jgi:hypothetical protein
MNWIRASLICQLTLLVYLQVVEWVNLFPWNDVRNGNGQAGLDIAIGGMMLMVILFTARRVRFMMALGTAFYALWLWLQIVSWWVPYFKGADAQWESVYQRFFAHTAKLLTAAGNHLPPDASHLVLQFLIVLALVTTAVATLRRSSVRRSEGVAATSQ